MIYDLLIPIIGAFIIICLILLRLHGRAKKDAPRRRTTHSGLVLERSPREKKAAAKSSSRAGPLILALAVIIIGSWLAISYFNLGPAPDAPAAEAASDPEEDFSVMTGRIVMGQDAAPPSATQGSAMRDAASAAGAAGTAAAQGGAGGGAESVNPARPAPSMAQASQGILPAVSRMEQVGLLPAKAAAPRPKAQKPPAAAARPKSATAAASPKPAAQQAAQQNSAPRPAPTAPAQDDRPILGGTREFTVHLASFTERGNAEKYMGKLASAREKDAFITESMVNGRLWYRVMSGRFPSQAEAEAHGNDLRRRNLTASGGRFVVKPLP